MPEKKVDPVKTIQRWAVSALAAAVKNGIARLPRHLRQDATLLAGGMEQVLKSVYWLGRSACSQRSRSGRPWRHDVSVEQIVPAPVAQNAKELLGLGGPSTLCST